MIPTQLKHLSFCRILKGTKKPFEKDWTNKPHNFEEISKFYPNENYGVICGYHKLAVIDCDKEELKLVVEQFLPKTFSVKTGGGGTHFYYFIKDLKKKIILNAGEEHIGEIQSYGSQVVGAGSLHPNGKLYEVINNVGIETIGFDLLKETLGSFMEKEEVVLEKEDVEDYEKLINEIVKVWREGDRQELALSVSGYLRKEKRLGIKKVKNIIKEVCKVTDDEEVKMRLRAVDETFKKDEKEIKGFTGLKKVDLKKLRGFKEGATLFSRLGQAKEFIKRQPLHYDKNKLWWVWNKESFFWERLDETDILNKITEVLPSVETIKAKERIEILKALEQIGRLNKPKELCESWIQFKNKIYDLETDEEFEASSEYFITNPIGWKLGKSEETPTIDKLFLSWVSEKDKELLYELLAFSIVPKYFIHRIFCLIGSGSNGKTTFLKLLKKFIGKENVTSSSLNLIMRERFEGSKLLNKLVCLMGETNFNLISNTDYLKKLTGEDWVRCEFKGKDPFDFENYAKLIMATNSLPPTADKTDGYYRRWKIIDFLNKFKEEKDVLSEIPDEEYENLALKCFNIVKRLWNKRQFSYDVDFGERKIIYEEKSNPLMKYIKEDYEKDVNSEILFSEFVDGLTSYLEERGMRILSSIAISKQLKSEGFEVKLITKKDLTGRFIIGLCKKNNTYNTNNTISTSALSVETSKKKSNLCNLCYSQRELIK